MKRVLIAFLLTFSAFFSFAQSETVKIGYYTEGSALTHFNEKSKVKSGYAYDYVQTLASYTGWQLEYVYGTFKELYSKLENGEIDLLTEVSYIEEKSGTMLFPSENMAVESFYLYRRATDLSISNTNFQTLTGKKVGVQADTIAEQQLRLFLLLNNLETDVVTYASEKQMRQDFNNSKISAIVEPSITAAPDWSPVLPICSTEVYLAVSKNRTDLLNQIEIAISEINAFDEDYFLNLWNKHNLQSFKNNEFTDLELDFIISHPVLKVGYLDNDLPFSNKNKTTLTAEGFVSDFITLASSKFQNHQMVPQYICFNSYEDMAKALRDETIDVIFPVVNNYYEGELQGFFPTTTVARSAMGVLYKDNLDEDWTTSIAISSSNINDAFVYETYPDATIHYYANRDTCLNAVQTGEVKATIVNLYKLSSLLYKNKKYKDLKYVQLPNEFNFSFGVKRDNIVLLSIFNKIISTTSEEEANRLLAKHAVNAMKFTAQDFFNSYFWIIIIVFVIIFALCFALFLAITKIKDYINYDALTHLLNRKTLQSCYNASRKAAEKTGESFCVMIMDLDDFKKVNDTHGHACGDEVLKTVARIITHGINGNDFAFRWGGEEILVIFNTSPNNAYNAAERIRRTIEENILMYKNERIKITATMGFAVYRPGITWQELFTTADDNLYKGKMSGKNQIVL